MTGPGAMRVLGLAAAAALIAVELPLWRPLLLAAILAGTLSQLHERLASAVGGRRSLSAALVTAGVMLLLLAPIGFVAAVVVQQALAAIAFVSRTLEQHGLPGLLARLPTWLVPWVNSALEQGQRELGTELPDWPRLRQALGAGVMIVGSASHLVLMAALMLVAIFFLLRDGAALITWAEQAPSIAPGRVRELLLELRRVSKAVLGAQLASGVAQAIVATIGYALAGVPSPVVFGVLSLAASFIPLGGVSLVGVPLAVLVWLSGRHAWAIFLASWTVVLTGLIDNLIRPLVVRGGTNLPSGLVFFSLFGGLLAFGPIGVVVGPLALALFLSVNAMQRVQSPPT